MRSEAEIRNEVETRLRRRGLLLLNGGLWAAAVLFMVAMGIRPYGSLSGLIMLLLVAWTGVLLLHIFYVAYVEMRERLVRSAIERERQFYLLRENYEKQKRSESFVEVGNADLLLSDDGELVDAPDERKVKASYER